ncbi:MAG: hypothetical protein KJT03_22100, partial [Verrucomicrobiae bacterium]|nr:hypothetical protein [Verrucomicrobiae bacterium]
FLNILFAISIPYLHLSDTLHTIASVGFLLSLASMSLVCFLSAWMKPFRHLFPVPVTGALVGTLLTLYGLS